MINMNKYIAFYNGKTKEIEAETSYAASRIAGEEFKTKPYNITVKVVEVDGREIVHTTIL
jgi:hypothetical protein